jgi:excisionase family DNA binding protein
MQQDDASRAEASPWARLLSDDRLTWTITEVAQLLGISRATAYEAAHRGELPVHVIGRRMLVPRIALLRLLERHTPT